MNSLSAVWPKNPWCLARSLPHRGPLIRRMWCASLACVLATTAHAEVVWVQPESYFATPGASLFVTLASAEEFGAIRGSVNGSRVDRVYGRLGGLATAGNAFAAIPGAVSRFSFTLPRPGVAIIIADLFPETRRVASEEVEPYFRRIHATDSLRQAWEMLPTGSAWRERRAIRLKSWIRVGTPISDDRAWAEAADQKLDLVAEADPTALRENDSLAIRVLRGGAGVGGVPVSFVSRGEFREHVVLTDENGQARGLLDASGPWLVRAVEVRSAHASDHDWDTEVIAVSFSVK